MKINNKRKQELLKDVKAGGRRFPMPRPVRFEDKTKYNRAREKQASLQSDKDACFN